MDGAVDGVKEDEKVIIICSFAGDQQDSYIYSKEYRYMVYDTLMTFISLMSMTREIQEERESVCYYCNSSIGVVVRRERSVTIHTYIYIYPPQTQQQQLSETKEKV